MLTGATEKETGRVKLCSFSFTAWRTSPFHRIFCLTSPLLRGVLLFSCVFFVREYFLITLNMNGKVSKARSRAVTGTPCNIDSNNLERRILQH